ncbi:hypothetical protein OSH39_01245 [Mycobacterium ulcerans]|uniref:Transmembrane protein n=6 Tax=Mycobacterium ulcerans group TaxID=2993898 RepID=A0A1B4XXR0_MYCUL|nr:MULTISPECIES: hypothetical protein [Mycobacterium ulcerans group]RFZ70065.1 hypothetical protein BB170200_00562 [Mycobacterium marinum]ULL08657.1 hypothetical protein CKW46_01120 [Mycobacterium liflandii]AGC64925.1 putative membrane protein [Mycobacterium liflandii 128FXT]MEB3903403.1 hypothetical protein [Mycobacterium ulcerans]MEB3907509.1 hypothetical protein [Mycobacterium ulcerans]
MSTTASVVDKSSRQSAYRRHGYFFRQAAMLTISLGFALHVYRVIFGDELTLKYVATVATDRILLIPMTYAAITGILVWPRVRFANGRHRAFFTASIVYIAGSVPLHIYMSYVVRDLSIVSWFPMWFSYLLLIAVYPAFLTMFWRLRYKD